MAIDKAWAELTPEATLEPELPICDPHHHLWVHRDGPFIRDLRYLADDLAADIGASNGGHNIVATVFIECRACYRAGGPAAMKPVGETEFVRGQAAIADSGLFGKTRIAAGIVGFADLLLGDAVKPVLQAHIEAGGGRFKGIRHSAGWDADTRVRNSYTNPKPGQFLDPTFRQGFRHLAPLGLGFEGWCYHPQLGDLVDLARAFPDTAIILNHFGGPLGIGPYRREAVFETWQASISVLAECANVSIKLGGLQMDINGFGWHERPAPPSSAELAAAVWPYYAHAIDAFGVERAMFESNFPVDKLSCSYTTIWNAFKHMAREHGFSAADKAALFHDTATRLYRL
jgi:predicted TIM-barrel fold metal-dependent hydrolase